MHLVLEYLQTSPIILVLEYLQASPIALEYLQARPNAPSARVPTD